MMRFCMVQLLYATVLYALIVPPLTPPSTALMQSAHNVVTFHLPLPLKFRYSSSNKS